MDIDLQQAIVSSVEVFMLVFVRMTGLFVVSPVFGRKDLPTYYKIGVSFFLSLLLTSTTTLQMPQTTGSVIEYASFVVKEFLVGVSIGFIPYLMFSVIYLAGQLIDMEIGFSMVSVLDPVSNMQIPITSNFYFIICILVFITVHAHHAIIKTVFYSYNVVPLGYMSIDGYTIENLIRLFSDIFVVGFKIAAPIVFTILLTDVALGIISKAMPQMNVFMVGMPLKILVGLVIIVITVPAMMVVLGNLFQNIELETMNFIRSIGME